MIDELETDALFADGFEDALIGVGRQFNHDVAIYDYNHCIAILMRDAMDIEEAIEYLEFNVLGAWVGPNTPVFLTINLSGQS